MRVKNCLYISLGVCIFLILFVALKSFTYPRKASFKTVEEIWPDSTVNTSAKSVIVGRKNKASVASTAVTAGISPVSSSRNSSLLKVTQRLYSTVNKSSQSKVVEAKRKSAIPAAVTTSTPPTSLPGNNFSLNNDFLTNVLTLPLEQLEKRNMSPSVMFNMYKRFVVVTSVSSNHFEESKDMVASIQKYLPQSKIMYYDLGLTEAQRLEVSKYCNVALQTFQWDKYPPHVKVLGNFAWKPLVVKEVAEKYDLFMYGDSSIRMKSSKIGPVLVSLLEVPFFDTYPGFTPIISLTHDDTIKYLKYPPSRKDMVKWGTLQGGAWIMLVNHDMKENVLKPWVDCALHEQCIAPKGSAVVPCHFEMLEYRDGRYIGCHRQDQSALNIILAKRFGLNMFNSLGNISTARKLWTVVRKPSYNNKLRFCK